MCKFWMTNIGLYKNLLQKYLVDIWGLYIFLFFKVHLKYFENGGRVLKYP